MSGAVITSEELGDGKMSGLHSVAAVDAETEKKFKYTRLFSNFCWRWRHCEN